MAPKRYVTRFILLFIASVGGTLWGFALLPPDVGSTVVWPPAAIGIAGLFLFGYELWPALLLGIAGTLFLRNGSLPFDIAIGISNVVEGLIGAYILKHYIRFNPLINTLRDGLGIMAASIVSTFFSAVIIIAASYFLGRITGADIQETLLTLWIGHAVTALSFAPFLIRWLHRPLFTKTPREIFEGTIIFGSITLLTYAIFWTPHGSLGSVSLIYVLIFPLMVAALRTGPRGTTLALALTALISTTGIVYGRGGLSVAHNPQVVFLLQVLLGVLDLIFILLASIVEERKETNLSLEASVAQLQLAIAKISSEDQAKTNFLAILAHELRNPLAPIVSSVELLKTTAFAQEHAEPLETIESHVQTISLLLDDLLDITRITHNKLELRREPITLQNALKRALEMAQGLIRTKGHRLELEVPEQEIWLEADPVRLEQIFVNLLNNAAKYTDEGGTIILVCRVEGRYALISIGDTGIGIAPDKIRGVFEPFGQIGAVVRRPGGLGVGLSLTKRLAELHGGTIEAKSPGLGLGSTFTVRLPRLIDTVYSPAVPKKGIFAPLLMRQQEHVVSKNTRIMVVDDNEPAAKGLGKLLEHSGYEVTLAYDGTSAFSLAKEFKPQAIVLDIGLPDIDGYTLGKKMRTEFEGTLRLIAVTGYGQEDDRIKTRDAGFDAHLVKPVSIADLERALSS